MARHPGWYEDPEGLPGVYRWWDGASWTVDITTDPSAVAPDIRPPAPQPQPTGPPQPSAPTPADTADEDTGTEPTPERVHSQGHPVTRLITFVAVVGVLILAAATQLRPLLDIDLPDTDDIEVPDLFDLSDLEPGPGPDGRYTGGGLSYDAIEGRWSPTLLVTNVPMDDLDGEETVVGRSKDDTPQFAYLWVGKVAPDLVLDGDLEATANRFADRFATRAYPDDARLTDRSARPTTIDGADAVRLTRSYTYRVRGTPITGEELTVVVVDTGRPPGVLVATVPDGYPRVRAQAERAIDSVATDSGSSAEQISRW